MPFVAIEACPVKELNMSSVRWECLIQVDRRGDKKESRAGIKVRFFEDKVYAETAETASVFPPRLYNERARLFGVGSEVAGRDLPSSRERAAMNPKV